MAKLLLAAMPSSGSDWLTDCIFEANPELIGYPEAKHELFSPICNPDHSKNLSRYFGCERVDCYHNIFYDAVGHESLVRGWIRRSGIEFAKDVWNAFQLSMLSYSFQRVLILTKEPRSMFPPSRARVVNWYCAIAEAARTNPIQDAAISAWLGSTARSLSERHPHAVALVGYAIYRGLLYRAAQHLPTAKGITWETLLWDTEDTIAERLTDLPIDATKTAAVIVRTRETDLMERPAIPEAIWSQYLKFAEIYELLGGTTCSTT